MIGLFTPFESHLDILRSSDISIIGSETVKGVDCYVLRFDPNLESLWRAAMQQGEVFEASMPAITEDVLQEVFTSFSVKQ